MDGVVTMTASWECLAPKQHYTPAHPGDSKAMLVK